MHPYMYVDFLYHGKIAPRTLSNSYTVQKNRVCFATTSINLIINYIISLINNESNERIRHAGNTLSTTDHVVLRDY